MLDAPETSPLSASLSNAIARIRQDRGWTLEELATRSGMHRTSLGLVERGERGMSVVAAEKVASALELQLSELVLIAEDASSGSDGIRLPRVAPEEASRNEDVVFDLCGLTGAGLRNAIEYAYGTLDTIDTELELKGSYPISGLVELANLSSMIGNLLGAGLAKHSDGKYERNRPHAFPDLLPQEPHLPDLELKMALEKNSPKGHLAKAGMYITFRYVLARYDGSYTRGKEGRGPTPWIWEVRTGHLDLEDFSISNTAGDSGKTAVIRTPSFKAMTLAYQDDRFYPYSRPWG